MRSSASQQKNRGVSVSKAKVKFSADSTVTFRTPTGATVTMGREFADGSFLLVRESGLVERQCVHGVGHPIGHLDVFRDFHSVHGCEGCCLHWNRTEPWAPGELRKRTHHQGKPLLHITRYGTDGATPLLEAPTDGTKE
jgi:hypothetical protein